MRSLLLLLFVITASAGDVLTVDDFETGASQWTGANEGKGSAIEARITLNQRKYGDGSLAIDWKRVPGGWCSLGRPVKADWSVLTTLRFWMRPIGGTGVEVRLVDNAKRILTARVPAPGDGTWQPVVLEFTAFSKPKPPAPPPKDPKAKEPAKDAPKPAEATPPVDEGKFDFTQVAELRLSPIGEGAGRLFIDHVDVVVLKDAQPLGVTPMSPPPIKLWELEAPLVKKTATVEVDGERIGGRISRMLASGWGDDAGEFADNPEWAALVKDAGLSLLRINARLDRFARTATYDAGPLERDLAALNACGAQGMVVIDGTPPAQGKSRDLPKDTEAWADMAAAIVKRINIESRLGVQVWQIWNEADSKTAWTGKPEEFAALAAKTAERMKRADPTITVLVGGFTRPQGLKDLGQRIVDADTSGAIDGLSWSQFALEKVADGGAGDALERTWGFERPLVDLAHLGRIAGRPLMAGIALRPTNERTVYNGRLDSVFTPVYAASAFNHLVRQNALLGCWQSATPQRIGGLVDGSGKQRPLVKLLRRLNAQLREHDWYWLDAESSTASVESLAAVSGDKLLLMLVNKDANGAQHETTIKLDKLKFGTGTMWTLGRGADGDEEKPVPAGGLRLVLPPISVTLVTATLTEAVVAPDKAPESPGPSGRTQLTVRSVDKAKGTLVGEDKEGRLVSVITGALKPEPGKEAKAPKPAKVDKDKDKEDRDEPAAAPAPKTAFVPGMRLEVTGKKRGPVLVADKCVIQGETATVPAVSDSGFNIAERLKGRKKLVVERLKPGFDAARIMDLPVKPALIFTAKQFEGDAKKLSNESDFGAKIRFAWNEENLYVVAAIQDETFVAPEKIQEWAKGDAMVLAFDFAFDSPPGDNDENDVEIVITAKDNKAQGLMLIAPGLKRNQSFNDGARFSKPANDGWQVAAIIPWTQLGFTPEVGRTFGFNLLLNESDKEKSRDGWYEWAEGLGSTKTTGQDFTRFGILELR